MVGRYSDFVTAGLRGHSVIKYSTGLKQDWVLSSSQRGSDIYRELWLSCEPAVKFPLKSLSLSLDYYRRQSVDRPLIDCPAMADRTGAVNHRENRTQRERKRKKQALIDGAEIRRRPLLQKASSREWPGRSPLHREGERENRQGEFPESLRSNPHTLSVSRLTGDD